MCVRIFLILNWAVGELAWYSAVQPSGLPNETLVTDFGIYWIRQDQSQGEFITREVQPRLGLCFRSKQVNKNKNFKSS